MEARMRDLLREYEDLDVPGYVGAYVYKMDRDPNEYFMAVFFEDRASYHANASDPAQHDRYLKMRDLLTADPDWNDGEVIYAYE